MERLNFSLDDVIKQDSEKRKTVRGGRGGRVGQGRNDLDQPLDAYMAGEFSRAGGARRGRRDPNDGDVRMGAPRGRGASHIGPRNGAGPAPGGRPIGGSIRPLNATIHKPKHQETRQSPRVNMALNMSPPRRGWIADAQPFDESRYTPPQNMFATEGRKTLPHSPSWESGQSNSALPPPQPYRWKDEPYRLTPSDMELIKTVRIVAQLDKVPKPLPGQELVNLKYHPRPSDHRAPRRSLNDRFSQA
eukprot:GHVN01034711.1.p1 GENE.GHVN01034711.1~~GHVN01034711.1.p1  ORF type:complete len:246 (+),score=20.10 GHVN01034711.1:149-886(+)